MMQSAPHHYVANYNATVKLVRLRNRREKTHEVATEESRHPKTHLLEPISKLCDEPKKRVRNSGGRASAATTTQLGLTYIRNGYSVRA
jgi:hypothetical protein